MTLTDQVQGFIEERRDPGCKYMYDQNLIVTTPICQKDSEPNIARRNVYALYGNILPGKKNLPLQIKTVYRTDRTEFWYCRQKEIQMVGLKRFGQKLPVHILLKFDIFKDFK